MIPRIQKRFVLGGAGLVLLAAAAALAALVVTQVQPSGAQVGTTVTVNQYAAKFLCGQIPSPASPFQVLAPGVYNTAVNIHNPNNFDVIIQKKAVISAIEPGQGLPGLRATHTLRPDASMEVDCNEIFSLLATASPPCVAPTLFFCKGYVVTEAAQIIITPTGTKVLPAQLDVTDIITVKEEDGIWKDYTFQLICQQPVPPGCQPLVDPSGTLVFRYDTPYNWPDRPPVPPCYKDQALLCDIYDVHQLITQRVQLACCAIPPGVVIQLVDVGFATDSRDVSLDFEFVTPKRVTYPQWPVQVAGCDLGIGKVGLPGNGIIDYTITVTCAPGGLGSGANVHVHDSWPPIVIFAGPTPSQGTCGPATANPFECDLGVIAAGGSATITFSVDTGTATVLDTATVDPHNTIAEPNEGNNTVTIACSVPGPPC